MGIQADMQKRLDDKAKALLQTYKIPNIAGVLVRNNGSTIIKTTQGIKDTSKSASLASNKVDADTYFNVGSISKPVTGFFIACLIKKGILSWNTRVIDVFPEFNAKAFRDACGMNENFLDIELHELIDHSSGMNGYYYFAESDNSTRIRDTDPFRFIQDQGIAYGGNSRDPEWKNYETLIYQRYLYAVLCMKKRKYIWNSTQNLGYKNKNDSGYGSTCTIAASMAERKMGRAFELIMTELLFDPVQMAVTFGNLPNGEQLHAYDDATGKYVPSLFHNNEFAPYSSKYVTGGMHFTVAGMAQYIKYNLPALNYSQVFDVDAYQLPVTDATQGGLYKYGSGNNLYLAHNGATGASLADLRIYPNQGFGYCAMTNSGGGPEGSNAATARDALFSELKDIQDEWDS